MFAVDPLAQERFGYAHLIAGVLLADGRSLVPGDGLKVRDAGDLRLTADGTADFLWFDLPA